MKIYVNGLITLNIQITVKKMAKIRIRGFWLLGKPWIVHLIKDGYK